MNCDDYLDMLSTLPVEELSYGTAREHAAVCRDCHRVTRVVAERERNMFLAYGDLTSSVPAAGTVANALATSRRRRTALYSKIGLGITALVTVASMALFRTVAPRGAVATVRESFQLHCLSAEQAGELLRPQMGPSGMISFRPAPEANVVNIEARPDEMAAVRSILDRFDNPAQSQCSRR